MDSSVFFETRQALTNPLQLDTDLFSQVCWGHRGSAVARNLAQWRADHEWGARLTDSGHTLSVAMARRRSLLWM